MKRAKYLMITAILLAAWAKWAGADVSLSPSTVNIGRGSQSTVVIKYHIENSNKTDKHTKARSSSGVFKIGSKTLGQMGDRLSGKLRNDGTGVYSGTIKESLTVPQVILSKAKSLKSNQIKFIRNFSLSGGSVAPYDLTAAVHINITTAGAADLAVKRIQLYFKNKRATISVKKRHPDLKAFADIKFEGSGLLQAYWQVDGRILSHVNRHIAKRRKLTLATPDVPALPTFSEGPHIVSLVVTRPEHRIIQPKAVYYVHPGLHRQKEKIRLIRPSDHLNIAYETARFKWKSKAKMAVYLVEFIDDQMDRPVFSAITQKSEYSLPVPVLKYYFKNGKMYFWRVKGFDRRNNLTGESPVRAFKLD